MRPGTGVLAKEAKGAKAEWPLLRDLRSLRPLREKLFVFPQIGSWRGPG